MADALELADGHKNDKSNDLEPEAKAVEDDLDETIVQERLPEINLN